MTESGTVATNPRPTALSWRNMTGTERTVTGLVVAGFSAALVVFGQVLVIAGMVL